MSSSPYKLLSTIIFILIFISPIYAEGIVRAEEAKIAAPETESFYRTAPPNFSSVASSHLIGNPEFETMSIPELNGYHVYYDNAADRWHISRIVSPGGILFEQMHGSILVKLDKEPAPGVNVWPIGFAISDDYSKNDRWGWVKRDDLSADNLYEIWWDITIDYARLEKSSDSYDTIGICFTGYDVDFNVWASGYQAPFDEKQLVLGKTQTPISDISGYSDVYSGIYDPYQKDISPKSANTSVFTEVDLPGASYNKDGLIPKSSIYSGSFTYQGNGVQFSVSTSPEKHIPKFDPLLGQTKYLTMCTGQTIFDSVRVTDIDVGDSITIQKISGPGNFTTTRGVSPLVAYYSYTVSGSGIYTVVYQANDSQGHQIIDSITYDVSINQPPVAEDGDTSLALCSGTAYICYNVEAKDPENDTLSYLIINGGLQDSGSSFEKSPEVVFSIDPITGELCLTTHLSGLYQFEVEVSDMCGSDTAIITIDVDINSQPKISPFDSLVTLCTPDTICFDVLATDPDITDSLEITLLSGPGVFTQTGNGIGEQCFFPADVDSARYVFQYQVTDNCLRGEIPTKCPTDSIVIIVIIGTPPTIDCSQPDPINLCTADSVCLPLIFSPADATVTVTSGDGVIDNGRLCFYADQTGTYEFTVSVSTDCGTETCTFTFDVTLDSPPTIDCSQPDPINLCTADSVCLPLTFSPADATVTVTSGDGIIDNGRLCFYADQTGTYEFTVSVSTDCGTETCTFTFDVALDSPPTIDCSQPDPVNLCTADSVCLPLTFSPADATVTVTSGDGVIDNGRLCFYADQTGTYEFTVSVSTDCGTETCTFTFDVTLDSPPTIDCSQPDPINLCTADSVCLPLTFSPADATVTVTSGDGVIDNGRLCFYADQTGTYEFTVSVSTDCGTETCTFTFDVALDSPPTIDCSQPDPINLCTADSVCLPLTFSPADATVTLTSGDGIIDNGRLCFYADQTGTYEFTVSVSTDCGTETCTFTFDVTLDSAPTIDCSQPDPINLCTADSVCLPLTFSPADATVTVTSGDGVIDNGRLCFYADQTGTYEFTVSVSSDCGTETCTFTFDVTVNSPPEVTLDEIPTALCNLDMICVPISVTDFDNNVLSIGAESSCGEEISFNDIDSTLCWAPAGFGLCQITVTVIDECDTITLVRDVEFTESSTPFAQCIEDTTLYVCEPGQICIDLGDLVPGTNISVLPEDFTYYEQTNYLCFDAEDDRVDTVIFIDVTDCGEDSCEFIVTTIFNEPPTISGTIEPDTVSFCDSVRLCFDVTIDDANNNIAEIYVEGACQGAVYDGVNSQICITVYEETHCDINVMVVDSCGAIARKIIPVHAVLNESPVIEFPIIESIVWCVTDTDPIVISDICVIDPDFGQVTLELDSDFGEFEFSPLRGCGTLEFYPQGSQTVEYCFRFRAFDECDTVYQEYCVTVLASTVCGTCITLAIEGPPICVNNGSISSVNITVDAEEDIAAFDLLLSYDASAITFMSAGIGDVINEWEFFTYRYGKDGNCSGTCPSGLLRLVAIADANNGPYHPSPAQFHPNGTMVTLTFKVSSDRNMGGTYVPISFFWFDCGDNTFSDLTGQYLYMDKLIINREGNIIWDETNDDDYPEIDRPRNTGADDTCLGSGKEPPVRCVDFQQGELCIIHPDSIDDRGDINLNGMVNEVADAVLLTNFFIYGLSVFSMSVPAQIAASDINGDGVPLTLADLVYLIRIISGDIAPMPKLSTDEVHVPVTLVQIGKQINVSANSSEPIGAALLVFTNNGKISDEPAILNKTNNMDMKYNWENGELIVLLYSFTIGHMIEAGESDLLSIEISEESQLELSRIEMADYYGNQLMASAGNQVLPNKMTLSQNYPNPFNPSTSFTLALSEASDYTVTIYNVVGQAIKTWRGQSEAGIITFEWNGVDENGQSVASGIYLYRAEAGKEKVIRKMVFLK